MKFLPLGSSRAEALVKARNGESRWRHPVVGSTIVAVLLLMVGVAWLFARDAPSSALGDINSVPRTSITVSQGCQNFAEYWLDNTSIPLEGATLEGFTNCREGADGKWDVLSNLPAAQTMDMFAIAPEHEADARALRARLIADIATFQQSLSDAMMSELGKIYSERANPVIGNTAEGASLSSIRTRYARLMNGFMLDPQYDAVARYVGWIMQQRIDAYGVFRRACLQDETAWLRQPCTGMEDNLSIRYAPWYWELASDLTLDAYLHHLYGEGAEQPD
ncbi:MAG: hypothetical protein AB7G88_03835 [Thermomicrobiales bacterium]